MVDPLPYRRKTEPRQVLLNSDDDLNDLALLRLDVLASRIPPLRIRFTNVVPSFHTLPAGVSILPVGVVYPRAELV